ncbi:MAG TPA: hypothetical protein VNE38_12695 [Ktedonobacteraceae bacterium]|nr:hypothetical protein [Ktedonobacteraceae bacterium]
MKSTGSSFETILEALLKQKQVLEDLQAEHETLRQQLADLQAGRGIFVEILGTRIPLATTPDAQVVDVVSNGKVAIETMEDTAPLIAAMPAAKTDASLEETTAIYKTDDDLTLQPTAAFAVTNADLTLQPAAAIPGESLQADARETSLPGSDFVIEDVSENETPMPVRASSSFLEDAMFAEFSTASRRHVDNWSAPNTNGPITDNPILDEDEKAALRRELMGSYILE